MQDELAFSPRCGPATVTNCNSCGPPRAIARPQACTLHPHAARGGGPAPHPSRLNSRGLHGKMRHMPALVLHQLRTRHVGPIDLDIAAGECVGLRGASGSGKSLLLRAIADLDPHQGEARLDTRACAAMPAPQWRRQVALVMAEGQWWAETVGEHFADGCDPAWLERLGLPAAALDWQVARCSTGERQRLALLRTLMRQPVALLLDEPTGNLDEDSTARVEALLDDNRRAHDAALLWVSHDPRQAARVAQRRFVLEEGRLVEEGEIDRGDADGGEAAAAGADKAPGVEGAAW